MGVARGQNQPDRSHEVHHGGVRYEIILPLLTLGTDPSSRHGPARIRPGSSRGARALAADVLGSAQQAMERLIERYIWPEQVKGRRRKHYGYRRRINYL